MIQNQQKVLSLKYNRRFRILPALLAAVLLLGALTFGASAENALRFDDVQDPTRFYYDPVYWASRRGVAAGVSADSFAPDALCTRAEIVTFLWRTVGSPETGDGGTGFSDVRSGAYYEKAVRWAVKTGVTSGTEAGKFSPDEVCTRAQAVTFLHRAAGKPKAKGTGAAFKDVRPGSYYSDAVLWAAERTVARGVSSTRFCPNEVCTRAQVVTFLWRAADDVAGLSAKELSRLLAQPAAQFSEHVFSHQGTATEEEPETVAAYDLVLGYGSRQIEQDLMLSSDGVLYCSHDATPAALTGETRPFYKLTSQEIDALRTKNGGHRILRMSDVFERYGKKVTYLVELKAGSTVVEPFLALVRKYGMERCVIVQSSELRLLQRAEEVFPDMRKLYLSFHGADFTPALEADFVDIISVGDAQFTRENCERVHAAGKQFCVAVCDPEEMILKAIKLGVDAYFTNYTARALELEQKFRNQATEEIV